MPKLAGKWLAAGSLVVFIAFFAAACGRAPKEKPSNPAFRLKEVMVPMRDGVHLQTMLVTPVRQSEPLPILLIRTPYGVPAKIADPLPPHLREWDKDGYIFVYQNLRGRFKSEGTFLVSSRVDLDDPKLTNETTDAYDTIDWLVRNVPRNNGKVGIWGVSYPGMTAGITLLHPHPALKAVSAQAAPVDQWMNDDMHRYGALRESYAVEYSFFVQSDKNKNAPFTPDNYDSYLWYLDLGPLTNINAKHLHGSIPFWNEIVQHPNYDSFWQKEAWVKQLHNSPIPNLIVAGFWDQEDPWGPWQIWRNAEESDPESSSFMVAGPWNHGGWRDAEGGNLGLITFGDHKTSLEFRQNIEAPFFRYYLHGKGSKLPWKASMFQTGSNTWRTYGSWPPQDAKSTNLYLRSDGSLTFDAPSAGQSGGKYVEYVSDSNNPVPYRHRPISPTYPGGDWPTWEVEDQRFVDHRPDVATFVSAPLDHEITVTGALSADIFASTSGTDSDFVVKLIDVYPQDAQKNAWTSEAGPKRGDYVKSLDGYELPIAMEVRRGRFNKSYSDPKPLAPNQPMEFAIPLRDHDHVFLKRHRMMVQIQSSWFPLIDRNPQKFVPSIYEAKATDFVSVTQRIYCSSRMPSHIILPVMP